MNYINYKNFSNSKSFYLLWIALRHLKSKYKKHSLSFMTKVSILGVMIGIAVLIIVLSVMAGFEADLKNKLLNGEPHLEVFSKSAGIGLSLNEFPLSKFKSAVSQITHIAPFIQNDVVIKHKSNIQTVYLFGIDTKKTDNNKIWAFAHPSLDIDFTKLDKKHYPTIMTNSNIATKLPAVILGSTLALNLGVDVGDEVTILNPKGSFQSQDILADSVMIKNFVVVGIFDCGVSDYDSKYAITSLSNARKFMLDYDVSLDAENYVSGIALKIKNPFKALQLENFLTQLFPSLNAVSWQRVNESLLFALKLEKFTMASILSLIIVVAAFSISGTLMMSIYYQKTYISLLCTLGFTKVDVAKIFLFYGIIIGLIGIVLGLIFGIGVCYLIYNFKFLLPTHVYYLKFLPVKFLPFNYVVISCIAFIFVILATLYPCLIAYKQNLSEGLRYE